MKKSFLGILFLFSISSLSFQLFAASSSEDEGTAREEITAEQTANQKKYEEHLDYGFKLLAEEKIWNDSEILVSEINNNNSLIFKMNFIGAYFFNDVAAIMSHKATIDSMKRDKDFKENFAREEREREAIVIKEKEADIRRKKAENELRIEQRREKIGGGSVSHRELKKNKSEAKLESRASVPGSETPALVSEADLLRGEPAEGGEYFVFYPKLVDDFLGREAGE